MSMIVDGKMNYCASNHIQAKKYAPNMSIPKIIGYMSVDVVREYHGDLSQLKYLNNVPRGEVHFDLNHNLHKAVKRTTDDNNEKINLLLKFLVDHPKDFNLNDSFITYRRTLISIMCCAYHHEHIRFMASLFNGSIYLCSLETPQEKQKRQNRNRQEDKFCAWGYKFEQYLLSDSPNQQPDIEKPVIENEEFSLYYQSTIGEHHMIYGAQIDGMLVKTNAANHPPNTNDFQETLNYLRNNVFVELKTNRELQNFRQEQNFKRFKMLRCWCQCYLAGLKGLVVGFRNDDGIIKRLQCYDTGDIVEYCKHEWHPEKGLQFLNHLLTYIKSCLKNHPNAKKSNEVPASLIFDVYGSDSVELTEQCESGWRVYCCRINKVIHKWNVLFYVPLMKFNVPR